MLCHQPCVQGEKGKAWESGGKKRLQRNFRAPHYTLPLGIFTPFISHLMNCLHFSASQAPQLFALVLVSLVALGKKSKEESWRALKCVNMNLGLFDFNFFFVDRELFFYITKIVDCLKLREVIVLQSSVNRCFLKIYLWSMEEVKNHHVNLVNISPYTRKKLHTKERSIYLL